MAPLVGQALSLRDLLVFAPLLHHLVLPAAATLKGVEALVLASPRALRHRPSCPDLLPRQQAHGSREGLFLGRWKEARRHYPAI